MKVTGADKILLTGASGFLGSHVLPVLKKRYSCDVAVVRRSDYDLRDGRQAEAMFRAVRPTIVVHLAARVGGILSNRKYPVEFYYDNILINTHVVHEAYGAGVKKMVMTFGGCSYPASAVSPIGEDQLWNGFPQKESAAYSGAKKMEVIQSQAYREEYGFSSVCLIPGNMYGEYDNYSLEHSHVIPAMIRKFYEAVRDGKESVPLFGTGRPQRDFVYAADVAALVPFFIEEYDSSDPVNISSGTTVSIADLAKEISSLMGYRGRLDFDTTKPDGQMVKIFDVKKMRGLGLSCATPLQAGLRNTITWFREQYPRGGVRL